MTDGGGGWTRYYAVSEATALGRVQGGEWGARKGGESTEEENVEEESRIEEANGGRGEKNRRGKRGGEERKPEGLEGERGETDRGARRGKGRGEARASEVREQGRVHGYCKGLRNRGRKNTAAGCKEGNL